jgi:hypothetical protein
MVTQFAEELQNQRRELQTAKESVAKETRNF